MASYGIFGKGSSGNSWFANKLDDFHDSTKKYDPLGHYAVELPLKAAHGIVEKGSKGLADVGIMPGFMNRLSGEAEENKGNFGLGSQRMGLGIASVLGAMYAGGAMGGGSGAGAGAAEGGAGGGFLGEGVASGVPAWDGAAGGAGLGFNAGGLPQGASMASDFPTQGGGLMSNLGSMGGMGGQGGGMGGQQQAMQQPRGTMLGNPSLTAALSKLVEDDARAKREQQGEILPATQTEQGSGLFGLTGDDIQRLLAMYQQQQQQNGGDYGYGVA